MYDLAADLVPTYQALFFQTTATPQTFGYKGEFTKIMTKTARDVKRFMDIPSDQIQVLAMHGTMLLDVERVSATYRTVYGFDKATADAFAQTVRDALASSTTMNGGNQAFWTFHSVTLRYPGLPDKIVMGDGILEGFDAVGFGDVAPQAIFAHELAHQIQYENEYFDDLGTVSGAERTRYSELMADDGPREGAVVFPDVRAGYRWAGTVHSHRAVTSHPSTTAESLNAIVIARVAPLLS